MIPALVPCAIDCCRLIIELRDHWQWYTRHVMVSFRFFQSSVWSMVRRITLPPSYADWTNFSFIPLKNLTDHSHKDGELVSECETLGRASCLAMAGRVTLSRGTIFSHVNTSARLPETMRLKFFFQFVTCHAFTRETGEGQLIHLTIPYKCSLKLGRGGEGCVGYPRLNKRGLDIPSVGQHFSVALIIYENGVCMAETCVPQLFVCLSRYQFWYYLLDSSASHLSEVTIIPLFSFSEFIRASLFETDSRSGS